MPNVLALHAVGESLRSHLAAGYPDALRARIPCEFRLLSTGGIGAAAGLDGALTLLLHHVTPNAQLRDAPPPGDAAPGGAPLSLDLHYLLTAWASSAFAEQTLLAWAARRLQQRPVLDAASLGGDAAWDETDVIHVAPEELGAEGMMRLWAGLGAPYRLSLSYVARVVHVDADGVPPVADGDAEEPETGATPIAGVSTSVIGFVGTASRGPVWTPGAPDAGLEPLTSHADFERVYGGPAGAASGPDHLAHAVRACFDNGGARLYVSRVLQPTAEGYATALQAFEGIEEISIVAAPGAAAHPDLLPAVHAALVAHAERPGARRIAVLDAPAGLGPTEVLEVRRRLDSTRAALYHPWVVVADGGAAEIALPPSGFVCGVYARTDAQRGVWKSPANEPVLGALRLAPEVGAAQQEALNQAGVNCLRTFPGRGILVWGARTAGADPEFRYVPVRRYLDYLEGSIARGIRWAASRQNDEPLWAEVRGAVERFLDGEWRKGALLGTKADEAFFVRCDRTTMTQGDIDAGRLICLVGVALVKPAEFVMFRVGQ